MSELAGFGTGWLPVAVQRRIAVEDAHERAEARRAEAGRADAADQAHDRALMAYRAAAEARGEVVSAVALATGEDIGRSVADVFAGARAAAEREDGRAEALRRRLDESGEVVYGEPVLHGASRSAWPASEWELDRLIREAGELHRARVAYLAKHDYARGLEAARDKSGPFAERAAYSGPVIYR